MDTVHFVQRFADRPPDDELRVPRGFSSKRGRFENSVTWYYNARGKNKKTHPNLSLYEEFGRSYGLRVHVSLPKYLWGHNVDLINGEEISDSLRRLSHDVLDISGMRFEAPPARIARIDFATDLQLDAADADRFFDRNRRFIVPRMPYRKDISKDRTLYHGNASRMLRLYDKTLESGTSQQNLTHVRCEYVLTNESAVRRFAQRIGVHDHKATTILSQAVRRVAINEMFNLLRLDSFDPKADYSFDYFFARTDGDLNKARRCSSFVDVFETLGQDFYQIPDIRMSRERYRRELRECQTLGF